MPPNREGPRDERSGGRPRAEHRRRLRDEEPVATIRCHPRRFGVGIPLVFALSLGASLPLVFRSLSLAIAIQLFLQTFGLLWLYVPVSPWRRGIPSGPPSVQRDELPSAQPGETMGGGGVDLDAGRREQDPRGRVDEEGTSPGRAAG